MFLMPHFSILSSHIPSGFSGKKNKHASSTWLDLTYCATHCVVVFWVSWESNLHWVKNDTHHIINTHKCKLPLFPLYSNGLNDSPRSFSVQWHMHTHKVRGRHKRVHLCRDSHLETYPCHLFIYKRKRHNILLVAPTAGADGACVCRWSPQLHPVLQLRFKKRERDGQIWWLR